MEKIKLELAKIVGSPSPNSWSQVHTFSPDEQEKLEKRGELLAVFSLRAVESGVEAVALGREILTRLHEEYYGNLEGGVLERLKSSLEKIKNEWPGTEIVAGVSYAVSGVNVLYLGILGRGKAVLQRENLLHELLKGEEEGQIETGSGLVKEKDVLLLGTSSFFEIVGEGVLKANLGLGNPQEMVESIAPIVLSRSDLAQAAAVICLFSAEEAEKEIASFVSEEPPKIEEAPRESFFSRFKSKFAFKLPQLPKKSFYIHRERVEQGKNKTIVSVALILIFLFLGSLVLGAIRKGKAEKESKTRMLFSQAEEKINQAKETIQLEPETAKISLEEALQFLQEAQKLNPKNEEIVSLKTEAEKLLARTKRDYDLGELTSFFDLGLLKAAAKADSIAFREGSLVILDSVNKSIYFFEVGKKSSVIFSDEKLAKAQRICSDNQTIYVLTEEGIYKVEAQEKKISLVIPKDQSWGKIVWLSSFAGNLYLLDEEKKTIWQYPRLEAGFGALKNWLSAEKSLEDKPVSMMIDGSIWVLAEGGKISKFIRGAKEGFELKGYGKDLSKINSFYLSQDGKNLYFLDPQNKKVLVFAKDGQFKAEYHWSVKPDKAELITVWEVQKRVFLIGQNLVFDFGIDENFQ